jgi:hypothetical protein
MISNKSVAKRPGGRDMAAFAKRPVCVTRGTAWLPLHGKESWCNLRRKICKRDVTHIACLKVHKCVRIPITK